MPTPLLPSRDDEPVPHGNGEAEDDIVKAIDVPAFVEDYIDQYRAICQRDPDRGGGYKAVGKARDALRDAIRRAIYDAERPLLADLDTAREDAAGSRRSIDTLRDFAEGRGDGYPVAGFAVIVRDEIASLRARANTATVAADLMRARAEMAEALLREIAGIYPGTSLQDSIDAALKARG